MRSTILFLLFSFFYINSYSQISTTISKSCGSCGGSVSNNARIGDRCPHCGVIWGRENTSRTSTNISFPSISSSSPFPNVSKLPSTSISVPSSTNPSKISAMQLPSTSIMADGIVTCNANLREQPYKGAYVLKVLSKGAKVSISQKRGNWFFVSYIYLKEGFGSGSFFLNGKSYKWATLYGWINCDLVRIE